MIDVTELKQAARDRWVSILSSLGIPESYLTNKHGPCPICHGTDRYRFDDKGEGRWFCNGCEPKSGDGIKLIQKYLGINFQQAMQKISEIVGDCAKVDTKPKPKYDVKKMLNNLWNSSTDLTGSDMTSLYLHSRKLVLKPQNVRFCAECYESDSKAKMPAMIAKFVSKEGIPLALHRTYLQDNRKADIKSPKKMTPGTKPLSGGAVRLFPAKDNTIGIAEGLETSIACKHLFDIPTWAALSTSLLEAFEPPEGIRKIIIYSDRDPNFAGEKSAYILANKLYLKDYLVEVVVPPLGDFADVWLKEIKEEIK